MRNPLRDFGVAVEGGGASVELWQGDESIFVG